LKARRQNREIKILNAINRHAPLGQLWRIAPELRRVFENLGIIADDVELGSLAQVCLTNGLDVETAARMLSAFQGVVAQRPAVAVELMELAELCDHVERAHHACLRDELENLDQLTLLIAEQHGAGDPRIPKIRRTFISFQQKILAHLRGEAEILFPLLRQWGSNPDESPAVFTRIKLSLERMEREHDEVEEAFAQLCALAQTETPAAANPVPVQMLHDAVVRLEREINEPIYKENQILFQRARAMSRCHR
jgi:regulator of cell morphogenesis and NO signaling